MSAVPPGGRAHRHQVPHHVTGNTICDSKIGFILTAADINNNKMEICKAPTLRLKALNWLNAFPNTGSFIDMSEER